MSEQPPSIPYDDIDPGIREVVRFINEVVGIRTCDSGDGITKLVMGDNDALDYPHVHAQVHVDSLIAACDVVRDMLEKAGVKVVPLGPEETVYPPGSAVIEGHYAVAERCATLTVSYLDDISLAYARNPKVSA